MATRDNMRFKVNTDLLPVKAHFFLLFAASAPVTPFLPILAKQLGIGPFGVGVMFAVLPFGGMVAKPLAGWVADSLARPKAVFLLSIFLTGLFYSSIQLVGSIEGDFTAHFECSRPKSLLKICSSEARKQEVLASLAPGRPEKCLVSCPDLGSRELARLCPAFSPLLPACTSPPPVTAHFTIVSNLSVHDTQGVPGCLYLLGDSYSWGENSTALHPVVCSDRLVLPCSVACSNRALQQFARQGTVWSSGMFWVFFLINLAAYSCFSVTTSISDAICFDKLQEEHDKYGQQRVWGSVGWGLSTVLAGYLVDSGSSGGGDRDYTPAFLLMAGLLLLDLGSVATIRIPPAAPPSSVWRSVLRLFWRPREAVFLLWCLCCGALTAIVWQWLLWYLSDLATPTGPAAAQSWVTTLLGVNMAVQCFAGEVPMFFLSGRILRRLGHSATMSLVLAAFSLRFLLYSLLSDPWWSLPIELLNGVTFGLCYATMAAHAHRLAPPGMEATMQGLVGAAFEGAGVAIGSFAGGLVYTAWGGKVLFRAASALALGLLLLHGAAQLLLPEEEQEREGEEDGPAARQEAEGGAGDPGAGPLLLRDSDL